MSRKLAIFFLILVFAAAAQGQDRPVTLKAGLALDGRGGVIQNAVIKVQGGRILEVGPGSGLVDYDLSGLTVTPGWIDTHVHLT